MGLMRAIWRGTGIGRTVDTVRNIVDEGSFTDGVKRTIKEDWTEDNPIGKVIYDSGKLAPFCNKRIVFKYSAFVGFIIIWRY